MERRHAWAIVMVGGLCLGSLACGDDDDAAEAEGSAGIGGGAGAASGTGDGAGDGSGGGGAGSATLTVGEMTFEASQVGCVFSAEEAGSPDYPFNLSAFGESPTGARAQLVADIYDPTGQERLSGDGVEHNISFTDIENYADPTVAWEDVEGPLANGAMTVITIDGKQITGEAVFDDGTTDAIETVTGTLEVTCP
ncbi:MAG: hypothetical protein PVI30_18335 [Myxococcales bacterium]|jgi:hypothetical protein